MPLATLPLLFFLLLLLPRLRTMAYAHTQRAALVQVPELQELLRHSVKSRGRENVVIIMMADRLLVQPRGKRPEAVSGHLLAQAEREAHQEQPRRQAFAVDAAAFPKSAHVFEEVGVGEDNSLVGGVVCEGVVCSEGGLRTRPHGERWHVDVAGTVRLHAVHKGFAGPKEALKAEKTVLVVSHHFKSVFCKKSITA